MHTQQQQLDSRREEATKRETNSGATKSLVFPPSLFLRRRLCKKEKGSRGALGFSGSKWYGNGRVFGGRRFYFQVSRNIPSARTPPLLWSCDNYNTDCRYYCRERREKRLAGMYRLHRNQIIRLRGQADRERTGQGPPSRGPYWIRGIAALVGSPRNEGNACRPVIRSDGWLGLPS